MRVMELNWSINDECVKDEMDVWLVGGVRVMIRVWDLGVVFGISCLC